MSKQADYIFRCKQKGLCTRCGNKAVNKNYCEKHRLEINERNRLKRNPNPVVKKKKKYKSGYKKGYVLQIAKDKENFEKYDTPIPNRGKFNLEPGYFKNLPK